MKDIHGRVINYLRISVTDRCNLRCVYCMPREGIGLQPHENILRNEEIARLAEASCLAGIKKIRLTGGEPLVRRDLVKMVASIRQIKAIDDLALTTNGILLSSMGSDLKDAGINRVNISMDTLDPEIYSRITRGGSFYLAWRGVEKALELDLAPVKLNSVIIRGINDHEIKDLALLTLRHPLHVRFIELMPVGASDNWAGDYYIPSVEIKTQIEKSLGPLEEVKKIHGNGPARYFRLGGSKGTIGFISALSDHFCQTCNRLRLTAEGTIRPCLYSNYEIDIREPLRRGADLSELAGVFKKAARRKPDRHCMADGWQDDKRIMSQIGG